VERGTLLIYVTRLRPMVEEPDEAGGPRVEKAKAAEETGSSTEQELDNIGSTAAAAAAVTGGDGETVADEVDDEEASYTVHDVALLAKDLLGEGADFDARLDSATKFSLLNWCVHGDKFGKGVPNSQLATFRTVNDIIHYFDLPPSEHGPRLSDKPLFGDIDMENLPPNLGIKLIDREHVARRVF
jgi:hypothetical protein